MKKTGLSILFAALTFGMIANSGAAVCGPELQTGIRAYLNYDFHSADSLFQDLAQHYPGEPLPLFYMLVNENAEYRSRGLFEEGADTLLKKLPSVLDAFDSWLVTHPEDASAQLYYGTAKALKARIFMNRGAYISAMMEGYQAIRSAKRSAALAPDYADTGLAIGTFDVFLSVIRQHYPWILPFMNEKSYRENGETELTRTARQGREGRWEAAGLLMMLKLYEDRDMAAGVVIGDSLTREFPENMEYRSLYAEALILSGDDQRGSAQLDSMRKRLSVSDDPEYMTLWSLRAVYLDGVLAMTRGDYQKALHLFSETCETYNFEFGWQLAWAYTYSGVMLEREGELEKARDMYRKAVATDEVCKAVLIARQALE